MQYISTRGRAEPKSFLEIVLEGQAPDGGLYMPSEIPRFSRAELSALGNAPYQRLAVEVIGRLAPDIPEQILKH